MKIAPMEPISPKDKETLDVVTEFFFWEAYESEGRIEFISWEFERGTPKGAWLKNEWGQKKWVAQDSRRIKSTKREALVSLYYRAGAYHRHCVLRLDNAKAKIRLLDEVVRGYGLEVR